MPRAISILARATIGTGATIGRDYARFYERHGMILWRGRWHAASFRRGGGVDAAFTRLHIYFSLSVKGIIIK